MKIIHEGNDGLEIYRHTCVVCRTVFEFAHTEAVGSNRGMLLVRCPRDGCGKEQEVEEVRPASNSAVDYV